MRAPAKRWLAAVARVRRIRPAPTASMRTSFPAPSPARPRTHAARAPGFSRAAADPPPAPAAFAGPLLRSGPLPLLLASGVEGQWVLPWGATVEALPEAGYYRGGRAVRPLVSGKTSTQT